jgi:hypothetical protein
VHQLTDADVTYVAFEASGEERVPVPIRGQ